MQAPVLDISPEVSDDGEQGLLSIAFAPDFAQSRRLYAYFTDRDQDQRVVEYELSEDGATIDPASRREVLRMDDFASNHNGGLLMFGPDALLYVGTGDGGGVGDPERNAQDLGSPLGKLLRIDPRKACTRFRKAKSKSGKKRKCSTKPGSSVPYTVPESNPFVAAAGRDEVYALGLRNPFRFSFDALTGAIAIGDVGQGCREEIDYRNAGAARGANFGWSGYEGNRLNNPSRIAPNVVFPILEYDNFAAGAGCPALDSPFKGVAVIPGHVVRDPRLAHQYGRLIYTDAGNSELRSLVPSQAGAADDQATGASVPGSPFSFAEGFDNQLFAISGDGPVYRLDP